MSSMTTSSSSRSSQVTDSTTLFEFKPGKHISIDALRTLLPDTETALFFCKAYDLDYRQVSELLARVFNTSNVIATLCAGNHSLDLQDYLIDMVPDHIDTTSFGGTITYDPALAPPHEVLPQLWAMAEVEVAQSIKAVAAKLGDTLAALPGKQGQMVFGHMARMNKQRPVVGTFNAQIKHATQVDNLVILDVSGSMNEQTVRAILDDVVALAWQANAHLAIVSNTAHHWEPGSYNADLVLEKAEFGGTHYEQLMPLMHRDWGTVVTIADFDSGAQVRSKFKTVPRGRIGTVLDISLVNQPTYLSQCLGEIADEVRPLLIGSSYYVLS